MDRRREGEREMRKRGKQRRGNDEWAQYPGMKKEEEGNINKEK